MQDQLLKCKNCDNPFVYSVYEQLQNIKSKGLINQTPTSKPDPIYCPICTSIKANEAKHPPKPQKVS